MSYWCKSCKEIYEIMTQDKMCPKIMCLGEELVEYKGQSVEDSAPESVEEGTVYSPQLPVEVLHGLCLLVCDASFSMDEQAFPDKDASKLRMVTRAVQQAMTELYSVSNPEDALIGIIGFGARAVLIPDRQGRPFMMSASDVKTHFGGDLNGFLYDCLYNDKGDVNRKYTDHRAALQLARDIYDGAIGNDMSRFGTTDGIRILRHKDVVNYDGFQIEVPNVRVMLYSDGEYNPEKPSDLINPFDSLDPSVLMTAFIGDESANEKVRRGADQMLELANLCPVHRKKGYFLINGPEKYAVLRKLFRMASGASGFCPECLKKFISTQKEETPHG